MSSTTCAPAAAERTGAGTATVHLKTGDSLSCEVLGAGPGGLRIRTAEAPDLLVPPIALVIGLFIALVLIGWRITVRCQDVFGRMIALGITAMIGLQAAMNIAVVTILALGGHFVIAGSMVSQAVMYAPRQVKPIWPKLMTPELPMNT